MTQEIIEKLKEQNNVISAQLEAHRALLNEQLQIGLNLRTNIIITQKQINDLNIKNKSLETVIQTLNEQIEKMNKETENAVDKKPE